jgi:hypothetical protein
VGQVRFVSSGWVQLKENNMRKLMRICFAVALLTFGVASAQDTGNHNNMMKAEDSENEVQITGTISDTGKTFVSESDHKNWTITNPEAAKGHEGHRVVLRANVHADKNEVHVVSVKMAK